MSHAFVLCEGDEFIEDGFVIRTTEETRTSLMALDVKLTPEELRYLNLEDA